MQIITYTADLHGYQWWPPEHAPDHEICRGQVIKEVKLVKMAFAIGAKGNGIIRRGSAAAAVAITKRI